MSSRFMSMYVGLFLLFLKLTMEHSVYDTNSLKNLDKKKKKKILMNFFAVEFYRLFA